MTHRTSLGSLLLATVLVACGDDGGATTAATTGGEGGESGTGGEAATSASTTAGTATTTSSATSASTSTATSSSGGSGGETGSGGQGGETGSGGTGGAGTGGATGSGGTGGSGGDGGAPACGAPADCAAEWEQNASDAYDDLIDGDPDDLYDFLFAVPKGGDLHQHLTGSVYAETFLGWAIDESFCIQTADHRAVTGSSCGGATQNVPEPDEPFYDAVVRAWSMQDFDYGGAESGHDHFFATFGKFGAIAGQKRNENLADIATRAASENQVYIETMFNLARNIGELTDDNWVGTLDIDDLQAAYDLAVGDPSFASELQGDVDVANQAYTQYRSQLGCSGANPPAACDVGMRFIAQVGRNGSRATVFGQLIGAFEMAAQSDYIVGVNLSSPEDETSDAAYELQMAMLDFLYDRYTATGLSDLHVTLHAGELTEEYSYSPASLTHHVRDAVLVAHAERIGHGVDILGEDDAADTLAEMVARDVLVETCLSSNTQILEVDGADHPLAAYIAAGVPVALATDDQGVSRSSMAGEYMRAALDQELSYRQLKKMARASLRHAFLPGESIWVSLDDGEVVADCEPTDTMGLGTTPNAACADFLEASEKARMEWELERRFRVFESQQ